MFGKWILLILVFLFIWLPSRVLAASSPLGEVSVMGSYSRTNYGKNAYATHKRYSASGALNVTPITEVEIAYTNIDSYYNDDPFQTALINEQILSLSIIQNLTPTDWIVQFYVKAGAAQYNRKQSGTIHGIPTRETHTKSPSALGGAGVKLYLGKGFSLKAEGVTYVPDLHFTQIKDNFAVSGGLGWQF